MRVEIDFGGGYNHRRYSKPWISKITDWKTGERPKMEFGYFVGNADEGGFCEIEAEPGDIICWGQKDRRSPRRSVSKKGLLLRNGDIEGLKTITAARRKFLENNEKEES